MKQLLTRIQNGGLICLRGDLGAGKTTYVKQLAEKLGINQFKVKSPTYTYIRRYQITENQNLYHIDLYRLEKIDQILLEEIQEILDHPSNIVAIEWPERMEEHLPETRIEVQIDYQGLNQRKITINYLSN